LTVYVDSSFLASLYVIDVHAPIARQRMGSRPAVGITPFNRAEFAHALYRQVFRASMTTREAGLAWSDFEQDCARGVWTTVNLPERVWETGIGIASRFVPTLGVRTLDSLHVACALELMVERFWTFDDRQAKLAEAVGLNTKA
jgi:predicted nucleic acid-binding protein